MHVNARITNAFTRNNPISSVILFVSVNGSGMYCGVARVASRLKFKDERIPFHSKKRSGFFGVEWVFVKDVHNSALRQICLPNNRSWPFTDAKDGQEIMKEEAFAVMRAMEAYESSGSILDDYYFYEAREALKPNLRSVLSGRQRLHRSIQNRMSTEQATLGNQGDQQEVETTPPPELGASILSDAREMSGDRENSEKKKNTIA